MQQSKLEVFGLRLLARLRPFFDLSAWVLVLVAMVPLMFYDRAMALTLLQWTIVGLALAGIAVVITRVAFPQIELGEWIESARNGDPVAPKIILAVCLLFGFIFLGLVLWAKA